MPDEAGNPEQWEVYLVNNWPGPDGQKKSRRLLVLQNSVLNARLATVLVAPIEDARKIARSRPHRLCTALLPASEPYLEKDSAVCLHLVGAVDKSRLKTLLGRLTDAELRQEVGFAMLTMLAAE